ncbi:hypothetical protein [Orbus mooreae]|uniref:hypothetical protein n=1 Tax=Orbus mooreae TaxID=3074107 RepID=UPI00370D644D
MKFLKIVLSVMFAVVLFGCSSKYQEPQQFNTPVTGLTKEQVKAAILGAGTTDDATFGVWKMKVIDNNTIEGTLFNRGYEAVVSIPYSAKGYEIKYVSASDNLKDKAGHIHRNYNRWVNNLNVKIQQNIFIKK